MEAVPAFGDCGARGTGGASCLISALGSIAGSCETGAGVRQADDIKIIQKIIIKFIVLTYIY